MKALTKDERYEIFEISIEFSEATNSTIYELDDDVIPTIAWTVEIVDFKTIKFYLSFQAEHLLSTDSLDPDKLKFNIPNPGVFLGLYSLKQA